MTNTFDVIQDSIQRLEGNRELKVNLRFVVDRMHEYDHTHEGDLSRVIGASGTRLEEALRIASLPPEETGDAQDDTSSNKGGE
jgi:hypothetical protein